MNHPPGLNATSHHMSGHLSMQGMNLSPHSSAMSLSGTSPMPSGQSPNSAYGSAGMPLPLSGQNTGSHAYQPLGASPLAGSLTAGTVPGPSNGLHNTSRRESITHFAHVVSPDVQAPYIVPSSSNAAAPTSRPSSSAGRPAAGSPDHGISELDNLHQSRAAPPAHLGPLPPSLFTGVRSLISPTGSGHGPVSSTENSEHIGASPLLPLIPPQGGPTPLSIAMEGLAHQGPGLGPPSTLHDRVVFVSSVS